MFERVVSTTREREREGGGTEMSKRTTRKKERIALRQQIYIWNLNQQQKIEQYLLKKTEKKTNKKTTTKRSRMGVM